MTGRPPHALAAAAIAGCLAALPAGAQRDSATYAERYRPQYHFSPAVNWANDPNGLVYANGEWHLFYQHNPFGNTWGHMSWGHAVSRDLVRWTQLPVAIPERDGVMAFSGSAVVDSANTSRFGRNGAPPLVAVYTGARVGSDHNQSQYVAYSTDRGRTWERYGSGPVLDVGSTEFRDPKVFWHAPSGRWVMVVSLATLHRVRFYASPDLKRWTPLSDFGPAGATGGVWECPDLFELPVDGNPGDTRWVLVVNINPGGPAGGSATQYFVGRFDGSRFTPDGETPASPDPRGAKPLWADYGKDLYATVSWSDVPRGDGRRVWVGWMNNWQYAATVPTSPWRSAMSLPRTVGLVTTPDGIRLVQQPVAELERLRGAPRAVAAQTIAQGSTSLGAQGIAGKALEIAATFEVGRAAGAAREFGLKVRTGNGEETVIGIDPAAGQLVVDRTHSGRADFSRDFPARQTAPLPVENGRVRLRVFVDWSSVEVFAGDGRSVITSQIFPAPESEGVSLYATGGAARLVSLEVWPMASAWKAAASSPPARPTR